MYFCSLRAKNVVYKLTENKTLIGRSVHSDVVLLNSSVSNRHAFIEFIPRGRMGNSPSGGARIEYLCVMRDLRSTNGTFVNNRRIPPTDPYPLQHGNIIRFGYDPLIFKIEFQKCVKLFPTPQDVSESIQKPPVMAHVDEQFYKDDEIGVEFETVLDEENDQTLLVNGKKTVLTGGTPLNETQHLPIPPKRTNPRVLDRLEFRVAKLENEASRVTDENIEKDSLYFSLSSSIHFLAKNIMKEVSLINKPKTIEKKDGNENIIDADDDQESLVDQIFPQNTLVMLKTIKNVLEITQKEVFKLKTTRIKHMNVYTQKLETKLSECKLKLFEAKNAKKEEAMTQQQNLEQLNLSKQNLLTTKELKLQKIKKEKEVLKKKMFKLDADLRRKNREQEFLKIRLKEHSFRNVTIQNDLKQQNDDMKKQNESLKKQLFEASKIHNEIIQSTRKRRKYLNDRKVGVEEEEENKFKTFLDKNAIRRNVRTSPIVDTKFKSKSQRGKKEVKMKMKSPQKKLFSQRRLDDEKKKRRSYLENFYEGYEKYQIKPSKRIRRELMKSRMVGGEAKKIRKKKKKKKKKKRRIKIRGRSIGSSSTSSISSTSSSEDDEEDVYL